MSLPKRINSSKNLVQEFRLLRGQTETPVKREKKHRESTKYRLFLQKYADLDNTIDSFTNLDLAYYFREIAEENGYKYFIEFVKDQAIFKRLRGTYTVREICGMIEFLYTSNQNYLRKESLSPNLLVSSWVNTIYADFNLWIEDKYVPKSNKKKQIRGEWNDNDSNSSVIGGKL